MASEGEADSLINRIDITCWIWYGMQILKASKKMVCLELKLS